MDPETYYVGLRKVQWLVGQTGAFNSHTNSMARTMRGTLSVNPSLSVRSESASTTAAAPLDSASDALRVLPLAIRIVNASAIDCSAPEVKPGDWVRFQACTYFGYMRRDSGYEGRPWIAFWAFDSRIDGTSGQARSFVMTGTRDGNVDEYWNGEYPGNRSGSGTEAFFDLCVQLAEASDLLNVPDAETCFWSASAISNMPGVVPIWSHGIAKVLYAIGEPERGRLIDLDGEVAHVNELLVATPLFVSSGTPTLGLRCGAMVDDAPTTRPRWGSRLTERLARRSTRLSGD